MSKAFVMWQDEETRDWFVVGRLDHNESTYTFRYTKGAKLSPRFQFFPQMDSFERSYTANELFPLFSNRLLPKSRPEYADFVRWLGLEGQEPREMLLLARGEGKRETDNITVHACPEKNHNGQYHILFFSHGIRYGFNPESSDKRLKDVKAGDRLFPTFDVQNPKDANAILLRTDDPIQFVGYCPRYLAHDFKELQEKTKNLHIIVERVNLDAPSRFKLLCKASADWPEEFSPCSGEQYQPIS
jgi:hypothetical protein